MAKYIVKAINNYSANATNNSNNIYLPGGYFPASRIVLSSNVAYLLHFEDNKTKQEIAFAV